MRPSDASTASPATPNANPSPSANTPATTATANLSNAVVNLNNLRDQAKKELIDVLNSVRKRYYYIFSVDSTYIPVFLTPTLR